MTNRLLGAAVIVVVAALGGSARGEIFIRPYLQNPTQTSMDVLWWSDTEDADGRVEYGPEFAKTMAAPGVMQPIVGHSLHLARITGLEPGESYLYRVVSGATTSPTYGFTTAPSDAQARAKGIHVGILGDGRTDDEAIRRRHREIASLARSNGATLLMELGDEVLDGSEAQWEQLMRNVLTTSGDGSATASWVPYLMAVGNHEIYDARGGYAKGGLDGSMPRFQAFVSNPENGSADPRWRERYFSVRYGPATFIVLDTNGSSTPPWRNHLQIDPGNTPDWEPGSEQYRWLVAQLREAKRTSAFTFVLCHPASYCRGVHGTNDPKIDFQTGYQLRALDPLFRLAGVDAVIQCHDHLVEHCVTGPKGWWKAPGAFKPRDPHNATWLNDPANLNYLVVGNSGEGSREPQAGWEKWMDIHADDPQAPVGTFYTEYYYDWGGKQSMSSYLDLKIAKTGANWTATFSIVRRDDNGDVIATPYSFKLTRPDPPAGTAGGSTK